MKRWWKLNKSVIWILGSAAAVVTAAALAIFVQSNGSQVVTRAWTVTDVTRGEIDTAFSLVDTWKKAPNGQVQAGIVPHHALVSPIIAGWLAGVKNQTAPATVVIIGPDHQNRGVGYFTTAEVDWRTPDGLVRVNRDLVESLVASGDVVIDEKLIQAEHGVYTALPYIRRTWPMAHVVTIAVKGDARPDRIKSVVALLTKKLTINDLVVATVDFSHYTSTIDALTADQESLRVLERGDATAALSIPVDSPPAISLVLEYAKRRSLAYQQLVHTTSGQFIGSLDAQSTTSYVSAYFTVAP